MPSLDMDGPYSLAADEISRLVARNGPGNYALGELDKNKRFVVRYVGRDDMNVRDALLSAAAKAPGKKGLMTRLFGKDEGARVQVLLRPGRRGGLRQALPDLPRLQLERPAGQRRPPQAAAGDARQVPGLRGDVGAASRPRRRRTCPHRPRRAGGRGSGGAPRTAGLPAQGS